MDQQSLCELDNAVEGLDVLEVHYWFGPEQRTSVGCYDGLAKDWDGNWVIRRQNRPAVRMIDVTKIRRLKPVGVF